MKKFIEKCILLQNLLIGKAITNRKLKKILVTENEEISISNI